MTRRRTVSFSEIIETCEPRILDKSSYSDYLNSWYSYKDHKYFRRSIKDLVPLLETYPYLKNTITFRGIERHTLAEKIRIKEKREISYCTVEFLQSESSTEMAKILQSHSDSCLWEAYNRALDDEKHAVMDRPRKATKKKHTAPSTRPPRKTQYTSRQASVRF